MNERNEKWLDGQLKKTVDSGKVEFDSERWKRKYSAEYQELISREGKQSKVPRIVRARLLVRIAAIIAIAVVSFSLVFHRPSIQRNPDRAGTVAEDRSPANMMSVLSLSMAYRQGGLDAVDEQCKRAYELLGQKNTNVSIGELLNGNGKKPERKEL